MVSTGRVITAIKLEVPLLWQCWLRCSGSHAGAPVSGEGSDLGCPSSGPHLRESDLKRLVPATVEEQHPLPPSFSAHV